MTALDLYQVSDALYEMRRRFSDYESCGVVLDGDQVRQLRAELKELGVSAQANEHEISRHRWNDAARRDREIEHAVTIEATRPGTNLVLLTPMERPFGDGGPAA